MTSALRIPVLSLTTLSASSLLLSFALSPGPARHPYLLYTSVLAVASGVAPVLLPAPPKAAAATGAPKQKKPRKLPTRSMEASYEVLGDAPSEEPASEDDEGVVNGEEVRAEVDGVAKGFLVRTGVSALAFAMAVMGVWGDGAPQTAAYI
jgi:autophagy-related protein 33